MRRHAGEGSEGGNSATGRRNFIAGGLAAAGLASAGVPARTLAQAKPRRIDVHHHLSPPPWLDALKKAGLDNPPALNWTPQRSATTSQIVFGSDYPYRTAAEHVRSLAGIFGPEDLRKIERENALKLLPRWRAI